MKELTIPEAQAYLAEQLRERIEYYKRECDDQVWWWKFEYCNQHAKPVLETEWLSIAHEVEGKMSWGQWYNYLDALINLCPSGQRAVVSATYTQRATAMKESGIKI